MKLILGAALLLSAILTHPLTAAARPNILLLCIDDLRPELHCFGVDYIRSPNIDKLAANGRAFTRHYVQAPTCGASRYAMLTGHYGPRDNGALFERSGDEEIRRTNLPAWFKSHGYTTVSIGKVSHHPGGRGGPDWDDESMPEMPGAWTRHLCPSGPWQHPRGFMHGLANGEIRGKAKAMDVFQAFDGGDDSYPDGHTTENALQQLDLLAKDGKPFFLAVGIIRPHLPFGAPASYVKLYDDVKLPPIPHPAKPDGETTWHGSGEFMGYNRWKKNPIVDAEFATLVRKHYAGCVSYADAQVGRVLAKLEQSGLAGNTIVVLWGDHGWHLGEHAIWGKHSLFEESLRSPLIICAPAVTQPGVATKSIVQTIDLHPTLCDLAGLPKPDGLDGISLLPLLADSSSAGHPAVSYQPGRETIRTDRHRLIRHAKNGMITHIELYDHNSEAGETRNLAAEQTSLARELAKVLDTKLNP